MNKCTAFHMSNFDEAGFEGKNVRMEDSESLRSAFPGDSPVLSGPPSITVNEKGVVRVAKEELASHTLNMNRFNVFFPHDKIQGGVSLIQQ